VSNVRTQPSHESHPPAARTTEGRPGPQDRRLAAFIAVIAFLLFVVGYLFFIHLQGVNVAYRDQWSDVQIIGSSYSGHLTFGQLWAQHNENRIFFPNLVVLALSRLVHFNIVIEEYISGVVLISSVALVVAAHRRRTPQIQWLFYIPVGLLMLSLVQYESTLWGFNLSYYMALGAALVALVLLDSTHPSWPIVVVAVGLGVVASYSSLQGLIVWPAGLILLLLRRRSPSLVVAWIACALVTTGLYFVSFSTTQAGAGSYALHHPLASVRFFLALLGDVLGVPLHGAGGTSDAVEPLGLVILVASVWAIVSVCRGRIATSGGPLAVALISFGLLFAGLVTASRSAVGISAAGGSRYCTFDLVIVVGLYLIAVEELTVRRIGVPLTEMRSAEQRPARVLSNRAVAGFAGVVAVVVCLQVAVGTPEGLSSARTFHASQIQGARVLADINHYPDAFVASTLGAYQSAAYIRSMARVLEQHHLSLFSSDAAAHYRAEGPIAVPQATMTVTSPHANSVLRGNQYLLAEVPDDFKVLRVVFEITGGGLVQVPVSTGARFSYGWIGSWYTSKAPNGSYLLQGTAFDAAGHEVHSPVVSVTVKNS
jgi:hypothetical protein